MKRLFTIYKNCFSSDLQNDIKLHIEEVRKKWNQIKIGDKEYKLSDLDTHEKKIIEELKNADYNDTEDMVYRMELTHHEVAEILDTENFNASSTR